MRNVIRILVFIGIFTQQVNGQSQWFKNDHIIVEFTGSNLEKLDSIEDKLIKKSIEIAGSNAPFYDGKAFHENSSYSHWLVPLRNQEILIYSPSAHCRASKYEISIHWDNSFTKIGIIGFSRLYEYEAETEVIHTAEGVAETKNTVTKPLFRVPLCCYDSLLSVEDLIQIKKQIVIGIRSQVSSKKGPSMEGSKITLRELLFKDNAYIEQAPLILIT
ncbi:MAG: hypothetical protein JKY52_15870, partial [Flavobacteriales bacterium]|nr:hypothetical protein [Flavobacteriales bacterium]